MGDENYREKGKRELRRGKERRKWDTQDFENKEILQIPLFI